jgi:hypothetical protein
MPLEHHGECDDGEKFIAVIFFVIERWKETMRHIGDTLSPLTSIVSYSSSERLARFLALVHYSSLLLLLLLLLRSDVVVVVSYY